MSRGPDLLGGLDDIHPRTVTPAQLDAILARVAADPDLAEALGFTGYHGGVREHGNRRPVWRDPSGPTPKETPNGCTRLRPRRLGCLRLLAGQGGP